MAAQQIHCEQFAIDEEGWLHGRRRTLSLLSGEQVNVIRIANTFWATAIADAGTAREARARVPMPLSLCGIDPDSNQPYVVNAKFNVSDDQFVFVAPEVRFVFIAVR